MRFTGENKLGFACTTNFGWRLRRKKRCQSILLINNFLTFVVSSTWFFLHLKLAVVMWRRNKMHHFGEKWVRFGEQREWGELDGIETSFTDRDAQLGTDMVYLSPFFPVQFHPKRSSNLDWLLEQKVDDTEISYVFMIHFISWEEEDSISQSPHSLMWRYSTLFILNSPTKRVDEEQVIMLGCLLLLPPRKKTRMLQMFHS